jgi:hypothetical protein
MRWDGLWRFGDVDRDGTLDIILGGGSGNLSDYGGYVLVMNGANFGQQLYKFTDGQSHLKPEQNFGFRVAPQTWTAMAMPT